MASQIPDMFSRFNLSEEELLLARTFTPLQLMYLQNLRYSAAMDKLRIKVDPNDVKDFVQQEAFVQAKIEVLTNLIEGNDHV